MPWVARPLRRRIQSQMAAKATSGKTLSRMPLRRPLLAGFTFSVTCWSVNCCWSWASPISGTRVANCLFEAWVP
jgi:hypothetical protein